MPRLYLPDARKAIRAAEEHFQQGATGNIVIDINGQNTVVLFTQENDTWNYGLPSMWQLEGYDLDDLEDWWLRRHPETGTVRGPARKAHGNLQANLEYADRPRFNYHVTIN
jgi:hypothetical protein